MPTPATNQSLLAQIANPTQGQSLVQPYIQGRLARMQLDQGQREADTAPLISALDIQNKIATLKGSELDAAVGEMKAFDAFYGNAVDQASLDLANQAASSAGFDFSGRATAYDDSFKSLQQAARSITEQGKSSTTTNINQDINLSKGQETYDKEGAKELIQWQIGGGFADAQKNVSQLNESLHRMQSGEVETGPLRGSLPNAVQTVAMPELVDVRESVEEVVQRNLREILGAQFTEKEGERLIARAFNEKLPTEVNIKRVQRLIEQIGAAAQAKQDAFDYFKENGTLKGYQGNQFGKADFDPDALFGSDEPTDMSIDDLVNQYAD